MLIGRSERPGPPRPRRQVAPREVVGVELRERFMEFPLLRGAMVPEWIPFGSRLSSSAKQTLSIH